MFSACFFNWEKNSSHWVKQNAPHGAVTNLVQVTSLFLWDLRGRQKQPFPKKAYHPGEKTFLPNFSHFIGYGKFLWGCKKHFDTHWGKYKIKSVKTKRFWKTKFSERKAMLPVTEIYWPTCSRSIEFEKPHETTYRSSQAILTIFVQLMG